MIQPLTVLSYVVLAIIGVAAFWWAISSDLKRRRREQAAKWAQGIADAEPTPPAQDRHRYENTFGDKGSGRLPE